MDNLINVSNINTNYIKRALWDVFIVTNFEEMWFELIFPWNWFLYFASAYINTFNINANINQRFKYNNAKDIKKIFESKNRNRIRYNILR
jgi:hypothetical protein